MSDNYELIVQTQVVMAESMASLSRSLEQMGETMVGIQVNIAETGRDIVHIHREAKDTRDEVHDIAKRTRALENITAVGKFHRLMLPAVLILICTAFASGFSAYHFFITSTG